MKRFSILLILFSFTLSLYAQEYYYWYKDVKTPLELASRKKFITIKDPSDSTQLKIRLLQKNYKICPFEKILIFENKFVQKECDWFTIVESVDSLPTISSDTAVLYESPCFFYGADKMELLLTHRLYVKLKQSEDFSILVNKAKDYNMTIYGNYMYMPLWYVLACTKASNGNALQIANSLYETKLFTTTEPEFLSLSNHLLINPTDPIDNTKFEHRQKVLYKINASNLVIRSIDDPIVNIEIHSLDGIRIFNKRYPFTTETHINLRGIKGLFILSVKLNSGVMCRDKVLLN